MMHLVSTLFALAATASMLCVATAQEEEEGLNNNLLCTDTEEEECFQCPLNPYPSNKNRNHRYEIRDMPTDQWEAYVMAMWKMKTMSMADGKARYGPLFKTHDYMVAIHAVTASSNRGDQGHFGAAFLSWHSAYSLMYETTLMRIAKVDGHHLEGLPYFWNFDNSDVSTVLSDQYYGTHPGLGPNYEIADGSFAYWPIQQNFDITVYDEFITDPADNLYFGNPSLRAPFNPLNASFLIGYPWVNPATGLEEAYTGASYEAAQACIDNALPYDSTTSNGGVWDFNLCVESPPGPQNWHSSTHQRIGGAALPSMAKYNPTMEGDRGDLNDPITSPNHPIFPTFHSNMDMFMREWQSRAKGNDVSWGFPYVNSLNYRFQTTYPGINANDVISSTWPFKWSDLGWAPPGTPEGNKDVTHAETTCFLAKENAPYIYVKYSGAPDGAPGVPVADLERLVECEAVDCDLDSDCATGLLCADEHKKELKAAGFNKRRAYCILDNDVPWNWEVCYDPQKVVLNNPNRDCTTNDKCGECAPRDCDRDNQCEDGFQCADEHKQELLAAGLDPRTANCGDVPPGIPNTWELCYKVPDDDATRNLLLRNNKQ